MILRRRYGTRKAPSEPSGAQLEETLKNNKPSPKTGAKKANKKKATEE